MSCLKCYDCPFRERNSSVRALGLHGRKGNKSCSLRWKAAFGAKGELWAWCCGLSPAVGKMSIELNRSWTVDCSRSLICHESVEFRHNFSLEQMISTDNRLEGKHCRLLFWGKHCFSVSSCKPSLNVSLSISIAVLMLLCEKRVYCIKCYNTSVVVLVYLKGSGLACLFLWTIVPWACILESLAN